MGLIKEKKFNLAKILSNNGRYVDDLNTQNYLHFESLIPRIYPVTYKLYFYSTGVMFGPSSIIKSNQIKIMT